MTTKSKAGLSHVEGQLEEGYVIMWREQVLEIPTLC